MLRAGRLAGSCGPEPRILRDRRAVPSRPDRKTPTGGSAERMARTTIHVCVTCRLADDPLEEQHGRAGARLHRAVADLAAQRAAPVDIVPVECLSVCKR